MKMFRNYLLPLLASASLFAEAKQEEIYIFCWDPVTEDHYMDHSQFDTAYRAKVSMSNNKIESEDVWVVFMKQFIQYEKRCVDRFGLDTQVFGEIKSQHMDGELLPFLFIENLYESN